ncbi:MAG: pyridoxal phosphate-dependent aminotransferase [Firmicutes bacterium]|nr:pyridoxal phosphate-dependent aminotransferase [Bacillota bacterium]
MIVSKRAAGIQESLTLAITAKAKKLNDEGVSVVSFGAGEPDCNTPDYIVDAAKRALDKGYTKYTPSSGIQGLRQAICDKLKRDNGLTYEPKQVIVSNGAKHSLYNAMLAIVNPGDQVILPAPYWLTYPELVMLCGGIPKYVKTKESDGFKMTAEQLKKAIGPKTKALILNSPSNPTGAVYSKNELCALAKVIEETGIYVIADEIYEKLIYKGSHYSIAQYSQKLYDQTILVNGMSKSYSMTGWRVGYLAAPANVAKAIDGVQSHTTSNPNSIAQYAALAALKEEAEEKAFVGKMAAVFDTRRKYMIARLKKMKAVSYYEPDGAFYVMVKVKKIFGKSAGGKLMMSAQNVAEQLLDVAHVAAVPGEAFGAPEYLRLSYCMSDKDIAEGLDRIEAFLKETK